MKLSARELAAHIGVGCAVLMLVAGCTSNKKSGPTPPNPTSKGKTSSAVKPSITPASSIPPPTGNVVSLFKTVQMSKCAPISGGWAASGTIHNTTGKSHAYRILVYFTTNQATVIDSAHTQVHAADKQTVKWEASKKFKTEPNMRCVVVSVK